jgi:protease-4
LIGLIRQVRNDDAMQALVLRLDTPGGSAFASELIRQELELLQLSDKPVVISMGPVAASGGYWVASTADAIFAEPTTLTGSIGVFGIMPTFEESLAGIGVVSDGVTTSELTTADPLRGLSERAASVLQTGTDHTYRRFTNLVARGRDLTPEQVEAIAQGRVWLGGRAKELGLVDTLGDLSAAANSGNYGRSFWCSPFWFWRESNSSPGPLACGDRSIQEQGLARRAFGGTTNVAHKQFHT